MFVYKIYIQYKNIYIYTYTKYLAPVEKYTLEKPEEWLIYVWKYINAMLD